MTRSNSNTEDHRQSVGEWLSRTFEWRIPVYQRHYAWDVEKEDNPVHLFWKTIKEQAESRLEKREPQPHYLGTVLVDNKTKNQSIDGITRYDVVDGQQRLTTIQIALLVLAYVAKERGCGNEVKNELKKYVFVDKDTESPNHPRLLPSNFDSRQFQWVLHDTYAAAWDYSSKNVSRENADKSKVVGTSNFFKKEYSDFINNRSQDDPSDVIHAIMDSLLKGVEFVLVVLLKSDNAQKVFESLNNYGKPLTTFDLIRNDVFHRAARSQPGLDEQLFDTNEWQQLEERYWEEYADNRKTDRVTHIEAYIARMLVAKQRKHFNLNRSEIFKTYKEFSEIHSSIDKEIQELARYTKVYQYLDTEIDKNPISPEVDFGVFRHNVWGSRDFYPVIFSIVGSEVSVEEKQKMIKLLESYIVRRGVCGLEAKNYNKYVATICRDLGDEPDYEGLNQVLKSSTKDTNVFPNNDRVSNDCVRANFYKCSFRRYVLEKIELFEHGPHAERVVVNEGELTIDHILPQGWEKNEHWKDIVLGSGNNRNDSDMLTAWAYIHTIGNLTLMSGKNNSSKSNRPLSEVKDLLLESMIKINQELAKEETWSAEKIAARSKMLGGKVCEIWSYDIE